MKIGFKYIFRINPPSIMRHAIKGEIFLEDFDIPDHETALSNS
jgi:hypothetical protein